MSVQLDRCNCCHPNLGLPMPLTSRQHVRRLIDDALELADVRLDAHENAAAITDACDVYGDGVRINTIQYPNLYIEVHPHISRDEVRSTIIAEVQERIVRKRVLQAQALRLL